jgi:hypothetical protein
MDIIGLISFIVFLIILCAVAYTAMTFGLKNRKLSKEVLQLKLDKLALLNSLEKEIEKNQSHSLENTDGFVKFLSESRDWAFKYIEDVQQAIDAVKVSVSYGKVSEESLERLFAFLPEQQGEIKNG